MPVQVSAQHLPLLVGGFAFTLILLLGLAHYLNRVAAR